MTRFTAPIVHMRFDTPLGPMLAAASGSGLTGLWFENQRHFPVQLASGAWAIDDGHPVLRAARRQVLDFLDGKRTGFELPLDLSGGTPFQQSVWRELLAIPCGATTTYAALSRSIGKPQAARAVGAAVGRNPVSIVVPCHRVLGGDGSLTGYAGGLERKAALLRLERQNTKEHTTI